MQHVIETLPSAYLKSLRRYFEKVEKRRPGELIVLADVPGGRIDEEIVVATPRTSAQEQVLSFSVRPESLAAKSLTIEIGKRTTSGPVAIAYTPSDSRRTARCVIDSGGVAISEEPLRRGTSNAKARAREPEVRLRQAFDSIRNRLLREGLSTPEVADRLMLTQEGVRKKAGRGDLLALKLGRDYRFPRWQFEDRAADGVVRGVREVLRASVLDPLELAVWFETKMEALEGRSPLEALASGDVENVVAAAEAAGVS